ncbi:MAG: hypothetical protein M3R62_09415, partial [Acidobacteriota bacterium]|nr:hypothetical protein [Acidobacteriota bacterium]
MTKSLWNLAAAAAGTAVLAGVWACSAASSPAPAAPVARSAAAPLTPTPSNMRRTNPNIVEEDETHFVERLPKEDYIRVDERHVRLPIMPRALEFYKEDESYYYIWTRKWLPEEVDAAQAENARRGVTATPTPL